MTRLGLIVGAVFVLLGAVIVAFAEFDWGASRLFDPRRSRNSDDRGTRARGRCSVRPAIRCCARDATSSSSLSRCTFRRGAGVVRPGSFTRAGGRSRIRPVMECGIDFARKNCSRQLCGITGSKLKNDVGVAPTVFRERAR